MTGPKNMSTRRLKRAYLRAVKWVWFCQMAVADKKSGTPHSNAADLQMAENRLKVCAEELRRRGWSA